MEAVERHGALRGGLMAVARLLRCHPFTRGGYDPVKNEQGAEAFSSSQSITHGPRSTTAQGVL